MKAYNLEATEKGGKTLIALGEEGRGRKLTLVKCVIDIKNGDRVNVTRPKAGMPGVPSITKSESDSSTSDALWLARISTGGGYIRSADGNVRYFGGDVELIAKGHGAFGIAGRVGTWDDVIAIVPDGTLLRVKPSRGNAYFLHFSSHEVNRMTAEEANFEELETEKEKYTRL